MDEKISFHESQIVYVFNFPKLFGRSDLINSLKANKFEGIPEPDVFRKLKSIDPAIVSNDLGKKNNTIIFQDELNKVLGIKGNTFRNVFLIFQELEGILKKDFDIDFNDALNFVECLTTIQVKTDNNAKRMLKNYLDNCNKFDDIFDETTYLATLRILPENKNISDRVWFDMTVEPLLTNPKKYFIRYVFRNSDIDKFKVNSNQINTSIEKVVAIIEGGI